MHKLPVAAGRSLLVLAIALSSVAWHSNASADPFSELTAFSGMKDVDLAKLSGGKVVSARGAAMSYPRGLSVQACYLVPLSPEKTAEFHKQWSAGRHPELKVYLHEDVPSKFTLADFQKLSGARDTAAVRSLVTATQELLPSQPQLQMSVAEAKLFSKTVGGEAKGPIPGPVATFWSNLLYQRALAFQSGGVAKQPVYNANGETIRVSDEISHLLKEQPKIRDEFKPVLDDAAISGNGKAPGSLYYEILDVEGRGAFSLGAAYSKQVQDGWQGLDLQFYSSDGYYVLLTFYRFWPVKTASGQTATLVWRGDVVSSASMADLHGVERLGSTGAMMKEIQKNIGFLLEDAGK